jgi:hypothetical protein
MISQVESKQVMATCWCICHKVKGGGFIMKHGLTCNQCIEMCLKDFGSRYVEYRCERVKPPEEEHDYFEDFGEVWGE